MTTQVRILDDGFLVVSPDIYTKAKKGLDVLINTKYGTFKISSIERKGVDVTPELAKIIENGKEQDRKGQYKMFNSSKAFLKYLDTL